MIKQTITLHSCDDGIRATIRKALASPQVEVVEIPDAMDLKQAKAGRLDLPPVVDYIVSKAALNSKSEGLAATQGLKQQRNDVFAVVLPEGLDYLRGQLDKRGSLVLVGADQAR